MLLLFLVMKFRCRVVRPAVFLLNKCQVSCCATNHRFIIIGSNQNRVRLRWLADGACNYD